MVDPPPAPCNCRILDGDVAYCSPSHAHADALASLHGSQHTLYRSYWRHGLPPQALRTPRKSKPLPSIPSYRPPVPPKSPHFRRRSIRASVRTPKPPTPPRPARPSSSYFSDSPPHPPSRFSAATTTTACTTPELEDSARFSASTASSTAGDGPASPSPRHKTPSFDLPASSPPSRAITTPTKLLPAFELDLPTTTTASKKPLHRKTSNRQASVFLLQRGGPTPRMSTATARERVYDELRKCSVFRAYFDEDEEAPPPVPALPSQLRKAPATPPKPAHLRRPATPSKLSPKKAGPPTPPKPVLSPVLPRRSRPLPAPPVPTRPTSPTPAPAVPEKDASYRASLASYSGWPDISSPPISVCLSDPGAPTRLSFLEMDPYPEGAPRVRKGRQGGRRRSVPEEGREVRCEGGGLEGLCEAWAE